MKNHEPAEISYLNTIIKKYLELINSYYPNIRFSNSSSGGEDARSCYLELGFNADCIKGTSLEVKEKTNLIHYTSSVKNIIEILNGGFLRINNLLNVNDPQEINFIIKKANIEKFEPYIEELKSTLFSASFCEVIDDNQPDTFAMWRLYGNDGMGCGIVFEIENYGYDWQNYILSQVQYGDSQSFNKFNELIRSHYGFQEENDFPILNTPVTLTALTALYKNYIWADEKEIRLLTHQTFNEYSLDNDSNHFSELKHSITNNNKMCSYVELLLYGSQEYQRIEKSGRLETLMRLLPILKVKEIILGYRIDYTSCAAIASVVNHISRKYGYSISVRQSHIKEYM